MKDTTKERIIRNAFQLYAGCWVREVSLSQIAAVTGISKTAIFRHFTDKKALVAEMKTRLYDEAAAVLSALHAASVKPDARIRSTIASVCTRGEYLLFLFRLAAVESDFEKEVKEALESRGVPQCVLPHMTMEQFLYFMYVSTLVMTASLYYIVHQKSAGAFDMPEPEEFAGSVTRLLEHGYAGLSALEAAERERLNAACVPDDGLQPESRFFSAIADLVREYGLPGVTVDRIAEKLHRAKSSLYSYSKNKHELIATTIREELDLFSAFLCEKMRAAKTFSEGVYVMLGAAVRYLCARRNLGAVLAWLSLFNAQKTETELESRLAELFLPLVNGVSVLPQYSWVRLSVLPRFLLGLASGLVTRGGRLGFSADELTAQVPVLYECIRLGPAGAGLQYIDSGL